MKIINITSCTSSNLSNKLEENSAKEIRYNDGDKKPGSQGFVCDIISIDGKNVKGLKVKIYFTGLPSNLKDIVKVVRENKVRYKIDQCIALRALPLFLFEGKSDGKISYGCVMRNAEGVKFADIVENEDGKKLNSYINLPLKDRLLFCHQFVEGMSILYGLTIIHADINGSNLIIDFKRKMLAIIDFDGGTVAKKESNPITWGKFISPSWVAPEIFSQYNKDRHNINVKITADLWSISCGIHYLLFGIPPFFFIFDRLDIRKYLNTHEWPKLRNINVKTHNKSNFDYHEKNYSKLPEEIRKKLEISFREGYLDPNKRIVADEWLNVIKLSQQIAAKPNKQIPLSSHTPVKPKIQVSIPIPVIPTYHNLAPTPSPTAPISTPSQTPSREDFFNRLSPSKALELEDETFNQFRYKILAVFTMIFGLLGLLFSETVGSYMLIVGAISIPIIIRKTTKTIIVPALCFVIIAIINYFLTGISPILAGAFGGVLFSLFFGYYFSRPLFNYQNDLHENIVKPLWFIAAILLLINTVVVIPFEFDNKNINETSTPTPLVSSIIHSEGELRISQTWSADLDEGVVGGSKSDRDFWFVAETATKRYLSPSNGVKMAIVGTTSVGINGCKTAKLLQNRIDINDLSEGTYVCVLTNQGRYSEFRVDEPINPSPGALIITYTTWETANPQSQSATKNVEPDVSKTSEQSLILTPSIKRLNVVADVFNNDVTAAATAGLEETNYGRPFSNGYYYVIDVQGEKYVALNGKVNKLAKLILEQGKILTSDGTLNYVENKTLRSGETWDVGGGWTLELNEIDHKTRLVWVVLSKDDIKKDDFVIAEGGVLTYSEDFLAGERDVPLFVTYMPTIFQGSTTDIAVFKYTWAISPSVKIIKPGDKLEDLEVVGVDVLNYRLEVKSSNIN